MSYFAHTPEAPEDAIFKLTSAFKADSFDKKCNLGVGAYRDNNGKPWVLPVVQKAKAALAADASLDHEYLPITGLPEFTSAALKLILGGDSPALQEKRASAAQTISGTGANHLGGLFLAKHYEPWQQGGEKTIYISNPTWANHKAIFNNVGIQVKEYPYYDPKTIGLDFQGFLSSIESAPDQSVFLVHACAHNPTGVDPTREQWTQLAQAFLKKGHFVFFDCAYQGFASGDLDNDAWAVRHFVEQHIPLLICQSFAKNAGLYGERVGSLCFVAQSEAESRAILSQLALLTRSEISNPPTFGARIVSLILNNAEYFQLWKKDIETMAQRIIDMRKELYDQLTNKLKTPGHWDHILKQIGMFSFTGCVLADCSPTQLMQKLHHSLNPEQCKAMVERAHIYMTANGRISMAGLNTSNVEYVAQSIDKAVRGQL